MLSEKNKENQRGRQNRVVFVFHGSPAKIYREDFENLKEHITKISSKWIKVDFCFIEHQEPSFSDIIEEIDSDEYTNHAFIDPVFIFRAGHMIQDIEPKVMSTKNRYKFFLKPALADREPFADLYSCFIKNYIEKKFGGIDENSAFLFVGRGTSDTYAAGDLYKFSRILWEKIGKKGHMFVSFAEVNNPLPQEVLSTINLEKFDNIFVVPILMFRGYVEKKIAQECRNSIDGKTNIEIIPPIAYAYAENFAKFLIRPYLFPFKHIYTDIK